MSALNIYSATLEELCTLHGVGKKRAEAIIQCRTQQKMDPNVAATATGMSVATWQQYVKDGLISFEEVVMSIPEEFNRETSLDGATGGFPEGRDQLRDNLSYTTSGGMTGLTGESLMNRLRKPTFSDFNRTPGAAEDNRDRWPRREQTDPQSRDRGNPMFPYIPSMPAAVSFALPRNDPGFGISFAEEMIVTVQSNLNSKIHELNFVQNAIKLESSAQKLDELFMAEKRLQLGIANLSSQRDYWSSQLTMLSKDEGQDNRMGKEKDEFWTMTCASEHYIDAMHQRYVEDSLCFESDVPQPSLYQPRNLTTLPQDQRQETSPSQSHSLAHSTPMPMKSATIQSGEIERLMVNHPADGRFQPKKTIDVHPNEDEENVPELRWRNRGGKNTSQNSRGRTQERRSARNSRDRQSSHDTNWSSSEAQRNPSSQGLPPTIDDVVRNPGNFRSQGNLQPRTSEASAYVPVTGEMPSKPRQYQMTSAESATHPVNDPPSYSSLLGTMNTPTGYPHPGITTGYQLPGGPSQEQYYGMNTPTQREMQPPGLNQDPRQFIPDRTRMSTIQDLRQSGRDVRRSLQDVYQPTPNFDGCPPSQPNLNVPQQVPPHMSNDYLSQNVRQPVPSYMPNDYYGIPHNVDTAQYPCNYMFPNNYRFPANTPRYPMYADPNVHSFVPYFPASGSAPYPAPCVNRNQAGVTSNAGVLKQETKSPSKPEATEFRKHRKPVVQESSSESDSSDSSSDESSEEEDEEPYEEYRGFQRLRNKSSRRDGQNVERRKKSPPAPQMQTFSGGPKEWENFLFYFDNAAKQYNWKKERKLQRLKECLRAKAIQYVRSLPTSTVTSYKKLVSALQKRFGSDDQPHVFRKNLFDVKQEGTESFDDFADRVQHMAVIAFKGSSRKTMNSVGVDAFLRGLRDKALIYNVAQKKPKDIRKALELVKEAAALVNFIGKSTSARMVTFEDEVRCRQTNTQPASPSLDRSWNRSQGRQPSPNYFRGRPPSPRRSQSPDGRNVQPPYSRSPSYTPINRSPNRGRCFNCDGEGHYARECPHPPRGRNVQGSQEQRDNLPKFPGSQVSRSTSPVQFEKENQPRGSDYKKSYQGSSLSTPGWTMLVPIYINGKLTKAVVDTGSQVTVIGHELAAQCGLLPEEGEDSEIVIQGVGESMEMTAKIVRNVDIRLGSQKYQWDLIVGPARELCILGIDFLYQVRASINLRSPGLEIHDGIVHAEMRTNGRRDLNLDSAVTTVDQYEVPPRTGRIVRCQLSKALGNDFIIEPRKDDVQHLYIPEALVEAGSTAELCVYNMSEEPIILKKNFTVASASPVDVVLETTDVENNEESPAVQELFGSFAGSLEPPELPANPTGSTDEPSISDAALHCEMPEEESTTGSENVSTIPDHLRAMFESSAAGLNDRERQALCELLVEFEDVFAKHDFDLGEFTAITHKIDTGNAAPVKCGLRRTPLGFQDQEEAHLKKMLDAGIIQPSTSDWAAAPVIVRKKCGNYRYCLDYRGLNGVTRKDNFPLPLIEECLDALADNQYFSTLDMASGYWQILIDPTDRHKTAFLTKYGLFEHVRLAMGLCNSPATYQRAMTLVLRDLLWKDMLAYLDDIIVLGKNFKDHLNNLRKVFERFRQYNLKFKPKKCVLFGTEVDFLGRRVSREGVSIPECKVKSVLQWPRPTTKTDIESFLGFINYHRDFIPGMASEAAVLYDLVKSSKPGVPVDWQDEHENAFQLFKEAMVNAPVLGYPRPDDLFILDTDASDYAIGAELSQIQDDREVVIAYGSMSLDPRQRRYCTTRKELLALVSFLIHFRFYLLGRSFLVRTDHNSLTWLMRFRNLEGQLARWIEAISQFDFRIIHRSGKLHGNADGLSRIPPECDCYEAGKDVNTLPCGGCTFCSTKHQQWQRFEDYVDDVVPLAVRITTIESHQICDTGQQLESDIDWLEEQKKDPEIAIVRQWLADGKPPASDVLYLQSKFTKRLWALKGQLVMVDGILHYNWIDHVARPARSLIVVPQHLRHQVLELAHDIKAAGHPGQLRTKFAVLRKFFWPGISSDIRHFVESCKICNTQKKGRRRMKAGMKLYHAGSPMERVHIDILGPFVESRNGMKYILVMVDQFTKWIELAPLADQTAEAVAQTLVHQFLCRMGCAQQIFSDQGKNFESTLFQEVCSLMEMAKLRTTPYRPSSNGQVERMNREILFQIRAYLETKQCDWDLHLPFIGMAMRARVNESTGFSPNMLMLGREVDLPIDLLAGRRPDMNNADQPSSDFVQKLQNTLHDVHSLARNELHSQLQRRKTLYDRNRHSTTYNVGDMVYVLNSASKKGQSRKLQPIYCGPYIVSHVISEVLYQIEGRRRRNHQILHHDRLRLCIDRDVPLWARRRRTELQSGVPTVGVDMDESFDLDALWKDDDESSNEEGEEEQPEEDLQGQPEDNLQNLSDFSSLDPDISQQSPDATGDSSSPATNTFVFPGSRRHEAVGPRKMTREVKPPSWMKDYVV
jgi:hypothetical protein